MTKKKALAAGLLGCAALILGIGWTIFLFVEERETVSAASMEPVQLEVCFLGSEEEYEGEQITGLLPGETVVRGPAVILDGTSPEAYIRIQLTFGGSLEEPPEESEEERRERQEKIQELKSGIRFSDGWVEGETEFWYYQKKVSPGSVIPVYEEVTIPKSWNNDIAEKIFTIEVSAEAVRSDHLEPWLRKEEIKSWE